MLDLVAALPRLLSKAVGWAEAQSAEALAMGRPLDGAEQRLARAVGVRRAERVRIAEVQALPMPVDPELRHAALETGLLGPKTVGLTLGYAVFILRGHASNRLLSHECRHVYQYETTGSIAEFLPAYLHEIVVHGYEMAPLEIDARRHERDGD
jgi:hypothetical protein